MAVTCILYIIIPFSVDCENNGAEIVHGSVCSRSASQGEAELQFLLCWFFIEWLYYCVSSELPAPLCIRAESKH